jgi:hypothetical protein
MKDALVTTIKILLEKEFKQRIVCLLYYGSNAFNRELRKNSDFDFCLVLDTQKHDDIKCIRSITLRYPHIEMTLHYLDDLNSAGWDNFQSDNHGVFYLFHFAAAKTLLGSNIFSRKIFLLRNANVHESLRRQIVEYFWRIDNGLFKLSEEEIVQSTFFRKYMVRIAQDIMVAQGDISFLEINQTSHTDFVNNFVLDKEYFSKNTKKLFAFMVKNNIVSVNKLITFKEELYGDFKRVFSKNKI